MRARVLEHNGPCAGGLVSLAPGEGTQRSAENQPVCHGVVQSQALVCWESVATEPSLPSPLHGQEMAPSPGIVP